MSPHCRLCDERLTSSLGLNGRCDDCSRYSQRTTFDKMLETLQNHAMGQIDFNETHRRCQQFTQIIETYPLFVVTLKSFDLNRHFQDRIALDYKRDRLASTDVQKYQNFFPVELETMNPNSSLLQSILFLCSIDAIYITEIHVRNIIDMVLNADAYIKRFSELNELCNEKKILERLIVDSTREERSNGVLNSITTLSLYSLSTILNVKIVSICPQMFGHTDPIHLRLHRTFSPLPSPQINVIEVPIHILWTSTKPLSSQDTSSLWLPDRVVPLLPTTQIQQLANPEINEMYLQIPESRFYRTYRCQCSITQSALDIVVPEDVQQARQQAEGNHQSLPDLKFQCPECQSPCTDYLYDKDEVRKYRSKFTRGRYTYILIDKSWSMASRFMTDNSSIVPPGEIKLSRFDQTKVAVKQLLNLIAADAGPMDKIVVNTFDNTLAEPALIPECDARSANSPQNLQLCDSIKISEVWNGFLGRNLARVGVRTHFYEALKLVYQVLERQPFYDIRLHVFSDGEDTSGNQKNIEHFRNFVRLLHQQLGIDCAFVQCGTSSANIHFANFNWLVDRASISAMSGSESMILEQSIRLYQQHHPPRSDTMKNVSQTLDRNFDERDNACHIHRTLEVKSGNGVAAWSINKFPETKVLDIAHNSDATSKSERSSSTTQHKPVMYAMGVRTYRRKT